MEAEITIKTVFEEIEGTAGSRGYYDVWIKTPIENSSSDEPGYEVNYERFETGKEAQKHLVKYLDDLLSVRCNE